MRTTPVGPPRADGGRIAAATGLDWAHPLVRQWFEHRFGTPTEPQTLGWPPILAGRSTLISAPTGSGKTLAAFLACIDRLVRQALDGTLGDRTEVLYVSPLKALGNDVQKNLDGPLAEIVALARARGRTVPEIRTAVRTGDTLMPARRAMLQRPPHILVTTPESLYILLTAARSREVLRPVRTVIVDEIHAMADDKRGAHLALSLERLESIAGAPLTRIGLSATQKPIGLVARFLAGSGRPDPVVVQVAPRRELDLAVEVPPSELGPVATNELWEEIYDRLAALVRAHRSTLVFVNTRRHAERITLHLGERLGTKRVAAHHGSLSRRIRLDAEERLKAGALPVLVATASLELGIDIGTVDLVCQIGSPRSIAVTLQRIGRAGHWRGAVPKGRLFATTRDDLVECAALVLAIRRGELDRLVIPDAPLDVLAQQIVAMCAAEDWREDELYDVVVRAYPYRDLPRTVLDELLGMLADGIAARRGRYGAYLHRDRVNGRVRGRRGARLAAITSGGAIPETGLYTVVAEPQGTVIGTVDEDFAVESMAGDVMLLGNSSWRIRRVSRAGRVLVEDAHGAAPTVPFWRGEAPARTPELSALVSEVRETASRLIPGASADGAADASPAAVAWLTHECGLDRSGAQQIVEYLAAGRAVLRAVPTADTIIAERFFDEGGGMQLVIHAPFGARINKAWGLALRKRFCRSFNFELQAAATDNGISIALAEQHSFPLADVFRYLHPASATDVLEQAALASPIFGSRWRWDAGRALALLRFRHGAKVPIHIQRLQSDDLLASVFPDVAACQENIEGDIRIPDHPLIREVMKDVLTEAMDLEGFLNVLGRIASGAIRCMSADTPVPSAFSHEVLNANPYAFLDDAPLEERRARAVQMRRVLPEAVLSEVGRLDPVAIDQVARDAWPDVRDADDLHDALQTLIVLPEPDDPHWRTLLDELVRDQRATRTAVASRTYWVAAERARTFSTILVDARWDAGFPEIETGAPSRDDALLQVVRGWMGHLGPVTAANLAGRLGLPETDIHGALLGLEAQGAVLRGQFRPASAPAAQPAPDQWCDRRLLARIHRLTLGALRREIAPVSAAEFMRWLLAWQHVAPGTQTTGERGTLEVLGGLQGFEAPANAWESQILRRRISGYDPGVLDRLCLTGAVGWGRLSPHPATLEQTARGRRRVVPTSVAPVTFFVRDEAEWMVPRPMPAGETGAGLTRNARAVLQCLHRGGAQFFADIVRGTGQLKAEVEAALWELVAAGLATADGFDNLRALVDPRRRAGHGSGRQSRPRHSTGRWTLLQAAPVADRPRAVAASCAMLLRRYGVVFRELLAREANLPAWRDLLGAFRRMEDRGEVRGGRFVSGFIGEQFALPVAVESLRAHRRAPARGERIAVSASDPLNLVGVILPGDRVPALSGRLVTFVDGVPADAGERDYAVSAAMTAGTTSNRSPTMP
jgi:ATP-dependent helicase Lhr and Lhr-like helicase